MKTEKELLELKANIEKSKIAISGLKGQETAVLNQLQEWNCKTITDAETKLKEMQDELTVIDAEIESGIRKLEMQ
jgi:hypothetical protein